MREWMKLFEKQNVERAFYLHVSPLKNLKSIQAKGLVPNHNGGNYDDMRWASLDGVYASRYARQLNDYLNAQDITDYLLVIIEVDMETALPDEDTIDIIFDHLFEPMLAADGLNLRSEEFEEMQPGEELFEKYVSQLAHGFHQLAAGKYHVEMDEETVRQAAEIWLEMKIGLDTEGEMMWGDLKDKLVHSYSKMQHPVLGNRHSVRIPSVVGFEGSTRIVGILKCAYDEVQPEILYNKVPDEARDEVNALVDEILTS